MDKLTTYQCPECDVEFSVAFDRSKHPHEVVDFCPFCGMDIDYTDIVLERVGQVESIKRLFAAASEAELLLPEGDERAELKDALDELHQFVLDNEPEDDESENQ